MFRGDTAHTGAASAVAPRQFHRLKWRFLTGGRVVSSPVFQDGVAVRGQRRRQRLRARRHERPKALAVRHGGPGGLHPGGGRRARLLHELRRQVLRGGGAERQAALEVHDGRRASLRGQEPARLPAQEPDDRRPLRPVPLQPGGGRGCGLLRLRRRQPLRARRVHRRLALEAADRRRRPRLAGLRGRRRLRGELGQLPLRGGGAEREGEVAVQERGGPVHPQPGRLPVLAGRGGRSRLRGMPRLQPLRHRRGRAARRSGGSTTRAAG